MRAGVTGSSDRNGSVPDASTIKKSFMVFAAVEELPTTPTSGESAALFELLAADGDDRRVIHLV